MTAKRNECECSAAPKLIFACSGAADVGAIADRVARQLAHQGVGNIFCLAGIAGFEHLRVSDLGMEKGKTPVIEENIARVANRGAERLAN
jgi:uncharacterized metal-binding protein